MRSDPIRLKGISEGSDMRHFLLGAEAWQGLTFLGVISMDWFAAALKERLDLLKNLDDLRAELAAPHTRRLGPPLEETRPMLPASYIPITRVVKAKRQAQRQKNKGRRAKAS